MALPLSEQRLKDARRWREVVEFCEIVEPDLEKNVSLLMLSGYARRQIAYEMGGLLSEVYRYEVGESVPSDPEDMARALLEAMQS